MRKGVEERIPTVNQLRISGTGRRVGSWPSWCCSSFFSDPWPSWTCSWVCWWRRHLGSQGGPLTNLGCWRLSWGDVRERNQGTTLNNSIHFASFLGPCSDFSEAERMWTAPVLLLDMYTFFRWSLLVCYPLSRMGQSWQSQAIKTVSTIEREQLEVDFAKKCLWEMIDKGGRWPEGRWQWMGNWMLVGPVGPFRFITWSNVLTTSRQQCEAIYPNFQTDVATQSFRARESLVRAS